MLARLHCKLMMWSLTHWKILWWILSEQSIIEVVTSSWGLSSCCFVLYSTRLAGLRIWLSIKPYFQLYSPILKDYNRRPTCSIRTRHLICCLVTGCLDLPKSTTQPWVSGNRLHWQPLSWICTMKWNNIVLMYKENIVQNIDTMLFFPVPGTFLSHSFSKIYTQSKIMCTTKTLEKSSCKRSYNLKFPYPCTEALEGDQQGQGPFLLE